MCAHFWTQTPLGHWVVPCDHYLCMLNMTLLFCIWHYILSYSGKILRGLKLGLSTIWPHLQNFITFLSEKVRGRHWSKSQNFLPQFFSTKQYVSDQKYKMNEFFTLQPFTHWTQLCSLTLQYASCVHICTLCCTLHLTQYYHYTRCSCVI